MLIGSGPIGAGPVGGGPAGPSTAEGLFDAVIVEGLSTAATLLPNIGYRAAITDTTVVSDVSRSMRDHLETVIELIAAESLSDAQRGKPAVIADSLQLNPVAELHRNVVVALIDDAVRIELLDAAARGHAAVITEVLTASVQDIVNYGIVVADRLRVAEVVIGSSITRELLTELLRAGDLITTAQQAAVTDAVVVATSIAASRAIQIIDELQLQPVMRGAATYGISIAQAIQIADRLTNFFGAEITDNLTLAAVLAGSGQLSGAAVESLSLSVEGTPQLLIAAHAQDTVELESLDVIQMLFQPTIAEGIELALAYAAPGGSVTTWTMNTRTGAVTEYQDFDFNSFAMLDGRYVAASSAGLFELLGDTDAGENIVARIKSGYMQFGGTKLSRLDAAYIAATGEGRMILKIITKEGAEYVYQADTRDGRSTKVHMGKGQRSRYFAFELTSAGQDFDLDTLEFIPVLVQRRV